MSQQRNTFVLGLTLIVMLALFMGSVIFIASFDFTSSEDFVVRFPVNPSVPLPLMKGGEAIKCGSKTVGKVKTVRFVEATDPHHPDGPQLLWVEMSCRVHKQIELRDDCTIVAEGPILGGTGMLTITDRGVSDQRLDPNKPLFGGVAGFTPALAKLSAELDAGNPQSLLAYIKLQLDPKDAESLIAKFNLSAQNIVLITDALKRQLDPTQDQVLMAKLHSIMDNLNSATLSIRKQLDPEYGPATLARVNLALDTLNSALSTVDQLVAENRKPIANTVASLESAAATVDEKVAKSIAEQLDRGQPGSLLSKLHQLFDQTLQSMSDLNVITGSTRNAFVLNRDRIDKIIANVKETSDHLKFGSKDLRWNPWRLLYRPDLQETKQLNAFDAAREFSDAATKLDDAMSKLQALSEAHAGAIPADDPQLQEIRADLVKAFERFQETEKAIWALSEK